MKGALWGPKQHGDLTNPHSEWNGLAGSDRAATSSCLGWGESQGPLLQGQSDPCPATEQWPWVAAEIAGQSEKFPDFYTAVEQFFVCVSEIDPKGSKGRRARE